MLVLYLFFTCFFVYKPDNLKREIITKDVFFCQNYDCSEITIGFEKSIVDHIDGLIEFPYYYIGSVSFEMMLWCRRVYFLASLDPEIGVSEEP